MSLTLDRMRFLVRKGSKKLDDDSFTNEDVDELLNLAFWELENRFNFEAKKTCIEALLVSGQSEYSVSNTDLTLILDSITSVKVIDSDGGSHKLARMTRDWLDANHKTTQTGLPERYLREGDKLTLYPIPGTDEIGLDLHIFLRESLASLVEGSNEATGLPRNWDELVIQGAISRAQFYGGDMSAALTISNFQRSKVQETIKDDEKTDNDSHVAGLQVLWDWPEVN